MILENIDLSIDEIMLDPSNPRFGKYLNKNQDELQLELMKDAKTKELLDSMRSGLTWVNKIVVREISSCSKLKLQQLGEEALQYKYIVVEGNTRLACLKDEKMVDIMKNVETIPIICAKREEGETQDKYERELKRIQGIANIMIVKDWEAIPKAKDIYELYIEEKNLKPDVSDTHVFKNIHTNLGIKQGEVKSFVYRYMFYKKVSEDIEAIDNDDFKFFEVFEQNKEIRNTFGWNEKDAKFIWEYDYDEKEAMDKEELLSLFPEVIKSAKREKISSKQVRDIIRKNHDKKSVEDFVSEIKQVINNTGDEYCYNNWNEMYLNKTPQNDEDRWKEELIRLTNIIQKFPISAEWAIGQKDKLEELAKRVNKLIRILELENLE